MATSRPHNVINSLIHKLCTPRLTWYAGERVAGYATPTIADVLAGVQLDRLSTA
jgi:hypothetical protein